MLLVSTFWGILGFHFQQNMWVTGGACVYLWTLSDRWKKTKNKKQVDLFTKPGWTVSIWKENLVARPKAKKLWMIWPGPPLKLATTGKPEAAASNKQRPNGSDLAAWTKTPWDFEAHLGIWNVPPLWSCMLIMLHGFGRPKFIHKKTRHVDLKKTIHNEKPWIPRHWKTSHTDFRGKASKQATFPRKAEKLDWIASWSSFRTCCSGDFSLPCFAPSKNTKLQFSVKIFELAKALTLYTHKGHKWMDVSCGKWSFGSGSWN